jgi:hypothetical protein
MAYYDCALVIMWFLLSLMEQKIQRIEIFMELLKFFRANLGLLWLQVINILAVSNKFVI